MHISVISRLWISNVEAFHCQRWVAGSIQSLHFKRSSPADFLFACLFKAVAVGKLHNANQALELIFKPFVYTLALFLLEAHLYLVVHSAELKIYFEIGARTGFDSIVNSFEI